jgi:glycosyltransferase involved in cell wall biosynthesis
MKIILLGENGSVHIQKWIRALADRADIEMHVITFDRGVKYDDVHYHYLKKYAGNKLDYILNTGRVKQIIKEVSPDLVHAHYATSYGYLAAKANFHPLVITGWGADIFDSPKNFFMRRLLMYSFAKADAMSVLSVITKKEISKYTQKDVQLIPFGVNTEKFDAVDRSNRDIVRIGTVRTLSEKYGIEYLIRAFAQVASIRTNVVLDIVGDGPQREFLVELTKTLGVSDKVTFHGYVNQNNEFERYKKLLDSFDIFSILSIIDSETFGVASVEASACGLPVVATRVGGLPEVVSENHSGLLVPPQNADETAKAFLQLIDDKSLRLQMGANGRTFVLQRYDWPNNVTQMVNLYSSLIGGKK